MLHQGVAAGSWPCAFRLQRPCAWPRRIQAFSSLRRQLQRVKYLNAHYSTWSSQQLCEGRVITTILQRRDLWLGEMKAFPQQVRVPRTWPGPRMQDILCAVFKKFLTVNIHSCITTTSTNKQTNSIKAERGAFSLHFLWVALSCEGGLYLGGSIQDTAILPSRGTRCSFTFFINYFIIVNYVLWRTQQQRFEASRSTSAFLARRHSLTPFLLCARWVVGTSEPACFSSWLSTCHKAGRSTLKTTSTRPNHSLFLLLQFGNYLLRWPVEGTRFCGL